MESSFHRDAVGGMWEEIGKLQFDFLVSHGLKPFHHLLVVGGGSLRGGVHCGDVEVFSLHATKVFGIGEGGAVMAPSSLCGHIRQVINFGLATDDVTTPGFNGKISDFHAAIGLAVLESLHKFISRRREVVEMYQQSLSCYSTITHPFQPGFPPWQTYPILLPRGTNVSLLMQTLLEHGLETRRYYYPPWHKTRFFFSESKLPVSDDVSSRMLCLPLYSNMSDQEFSEIVVIFHRVFPDFLVS